MYELNSDLCKKYVVYNVVKWTHEKTAFEISDIILDYLGKNIKNWARDLCEVAIASYGSLDL